MDYQKTINILSLLWEHIMRADTKNAKKIYNWLNKDNLSSITLDGNVFWLETTNSITIIPNYVYNYIKKWCKKQGYIYLYDIKTN